MNENIRVTSTARRISRSWLWRLLGVLLVMNIALLAISVLIYCYARESAALGDAWTPGIARSFCLPGYAGDQPLMHNIKQALTLLPVAQYSLSAPGGVHVVPLGPYFRLLKPAALTLLGFEAAIVLFQAASMRKTARRLLEPIDRMARAARRLTKNAQYAPPAPAELGDERLQDLENAISRISPDHPEQKLNMGDKDLAGLQDAINGLLGRMHESYRQQAQFVSDASHELRTPISVIQGYAGMLDRWGKQDEKILDESIAAIKSEAAYMNRLVEQLLFLARGDTGRQRMDIRRVNLGELAKEVYEDCQIIDRNHDWRIDVQDEICCMGDRDMLKQCARVLADNAMKYTPAGGMIRLRACKNDAGWPCLQVQDSGMGISAEDAPHVFDRFYRSDPARSRQSGGTGLGLAIACWIAQSHSGHIDLLSRPDLGTRMTLCLPPPAAEN